LVARQWGAPHPIADKKVSDRVTRRSSNPLDAAAVVVLRHRNQPLALMPGKYLFGRDRRCNLVLSGVVISRKHACLQACADSKVILKDLGSHNGVCVNGRNIGDELVSLRPGDWFVLGSEMFAVDPEDDSCPGDPTSVVRVVTERDHVVLMDPLMTALDDTQSAHDIDMSCAIAERTITAGEFAEAEHLLAAPLRSVLADTLTSRTISRRIHDKALHYALRLAEETQSGAWLHYGFDLLIAGTTVCTEEQVKHFIRAQKRIGHADAGRLHRYLEILRRKAPTIENLRIIALFESMRGTPSAEE
jgi:hypothetical protein